VEWPVVVNDTRYTLFVTSQYDVILTFGVGLAKFVDTACKLFQTHTPYSLLRSTMCHCNTHKLISAPS